MQFLERSRPTSGAGTLGYSLDLPERLREDLPHIETLPGILKTPGDSLCTRPYRPFRRKRTNSMRKSLHFSVQGENQTPPAGVSHPHGREGSVQYVSKPSPRQQKSSLCCQRGMPRNVEHVPSMQGFPAPASTRSAPRQ